MRRKDLAMTQEATFALVDAKEYAVICLTDPDGSGSTPEFWSLV